MKSDDSAQIFLSIALKANEIMSDVIDIGANLILQKHKLFPNTVLSETFSMVILAWNTKHAVIIWDYDNT